MEALDGCNVTVAAPLVRFQMENVYRTLYVLEAPNDPEVVLDILNGTELRKLKAFDTEVRAATSAIYSRPTTAWASTVVLARP